MKIYIASRYSRRDEMQKVAARLDHEVTSQWIWQDDDNGRGAAEGCLRDIDRSDILVLFSDPVKSRNPGGGRWFEMGYAHALGLRIIVVGHKETIYCHLPSVTWCPNVEGLIALLQ